MKNLFQCSTTTTLSYIKVDDLMDDCITSTLNSTKAVMVLVSFLFKMVTRDYPLYLKPYDYSKERVMSKVLCSTVELLLYTVDMCVFTIIIH